MSVERAIGDLLDYPFSINVIGHCCNDEGVMGSGIALGIRTRYPAAYEAYVTSHKRGERLGSLSFAEVGEGRKVANLVAQHGYGKGIRHLDYEAFYSTLSILRDALENAHKEGRYYVLGLPDGMGCVRAGGSRPVVDAMILDVFALSPVRCVIVKLPDNP